MTLLLTQGNALQIPLADESVHCVVTSPPYWGLRDYGTATWEGGDAECDHTITHWNDNLKPNTNRPFRGDRSKCLHCGAIRIDNQLGLEPTPEQYVANMVAVFREVKRVMRHDATLWLNIADSYASKPYEPWGIKPKDECDIPFHLKIALKKDGWYARCTVIWSKPNPMPESVTDRPTKAHEYLFLLTKSARYYYDADAVREAANMETQRGTPAPNVTESIGNMGGNKRTDFEKNRHKVSHRNRRTVWQIATAPYSGAHFATYPPALVEPCIKAGTSEHGVCPECGAPWERVTEPTPEYAEFLGKGWNDHTKDNTHGSIKDDTKGARTTKQTTTLGWQPTCDHYEPGLVEDEKLSGKFGDPIPATVFDPFAGSGTTLQVARQLGRNGVGLDLSLEYLRLARTRLSLDALDAWTDGAGQSDNGKDNAHKNKQVPGRQTHSFHEARNEKDVTDLPMFEEMT